MESILRGRASTLLAPLFALSLLSGAANAELIQNGSFEIATATTTTVFNVAGLANWADTPGNGEALVFPSWFTNGYLFPGVGLAGPWPQFSPDGGNFLYSDSDFLTAPVSQTVGGLTLGHTYNLSFFEGLDQDTESLTTPGPVTGHWHVTFGADIQDGPGLTADGSLQTFSPWAQENMSFVASGSSEVLTFLAVGNGAPPLMMLDGVHMEDAAPEPAGIWLAALGGVLLAWKAVTRHSQRVRP